MKNTRKTKNALITGSSKGIGREFAKILAKKQYNLVLVDKDWENCSTLKGDLESEYGITVMTFVEDLSMAETPLKIYSALMSKRIEIDVLINNAGIGIFGKFSDTDWHHEENILKVNIMALTYFTKLFMKGMIARKKGKILNVASIGAFQAVPLQSVYAASKAYVLSFTEAIARELKETGVTVTALCPGPTDTGFHILARGDDKKAFKRKKMPTAREVAIHGYNAMMRGEHVSIHGFINTLMINVSRIIPRKILAKLAHKKMRVHLEDI